MWTWRPGGSEYWENVVTDMSCSLGQSLVVFVGTLGLAKVDIYLFLVPAPDGMHLIRTPHGAWRSYFYKYDPVSKRSIRVHWYLPKGDGFTHEQALRRLKRAIPKSIRGVPFGQRPLGCTTVRYVVMRIGFRAGIHVNPQLIRHTFATHLLDNGADIRMIQKMLGHISVGTTQTYTHVSMSQVQKVLEKCHPRNL